MTEEEARLRESALVLTVTALAPAFGHRTCANPRWCSRSPHFDHEHHVNQCKNKTRCIHCLDTGHISKGCPTSHLPWVPLPPLPVTRRLPQEPPVHTGYLYAAAATCSAAAQAARVDDGRDIGLQQLRQAATAHQGGARPHAGDDGGGGQVVRIRAGAHDHRTCPHLAPGHISDGLLQDFPELPVGSFQISLLHHGTFFVRFLEPRWFQLVAAQLVFHCDGMPVLIHCWSRLTFAKFCKYRYIMRLFLERLTTQAWTFTMVQQALPSCLIHTIVEETLVKLDISYYVMEAWVDRLDDVLIEVTIDIHEPRPCIDPLDHVLMPPGFSSSDLPVPGEGTPTTRCHQQYLTMVPPRVLSTTTLVHLDSSMFIRTVSAPRKRWTSWDDDDYFDYRSSGNQGRCNCSQRNTPPPLPRKAFPFLECWGQRARRCCLNHAMQGGDAALGVVTTPPARDALSTTLVPMEGLVPCSVWPHLPTTPADEPASAAPITPAAQPAGEASPLEMLLGRVCGPVSPTVLPTPDAAPPRLERRRRSPASATRCSHYVQNKWTKKAATGSGNTTMLLARQLIISKKGGLAIVESGEKEEEQALEEYATALDEPLDDNKIEELADLSKSGHAGMPRRIAARDALPMPSVPFSVKINLVISYSILAWNVCGLNSRVHYCERSCAIVSPCYCLFSRIQSSSC
ncbi:hypothetical protein ACQ4PT_054935 [Festuca glaucescens]